jgi:hypothetical protein
VTEGPSATADGGAENSSFAIRPSRSVRPIGSKSGSVGAVAMRAPAKATPGVVPLAEGTCGVSPCVGSCPE